MKQKPGLLQHSAGGHVLAGDTPKHGARRELQEELFANTQLPELSIRKVTSFLQYDIPKNRELVHVYETIYGGPFFPDTGEVAEEPHWIQWKQLLLDTAAKPELFTPSFLFVLSEYRKVTELH